METKSSPRKKDVTVRLKYAMVEDASSVTFSQRGSSLPCQMRMKKIPNEIMGDPGANI